uniref:NAD(P)H-quinone oxidoreductase chain 4, chloroplastic n=2 Tax=Lygodium japonicum TaxID=13824 RepID=A0A059SR78_LYGJA|nr:NADH-plastoquinone oxidoreductase subunit 4 [Lygodium japonicum]
MMSNVPRLTIIVLFPIFAGFLIPLFPQSESSRMVRWYTLGICTLEFVLITYIFYCHFHIHDQSIQLLENFSWIDSIQFHWRLGIDGLSMSLILLTGLVTTAAVSSAWPVTKNTHLFYFSMLVMYSGQIGLFASRDILLFFFMWELELIPIYLLLSIWGGKRRLYSATKFVLYTAGGSIFLLVGAIVMSFYGGGTPSFNIQDLIVKPYPVSLEALLYTGFLVTYAVKLPIFPFHTWLPDTHGEAHYSTCMLLAGVLLKMGGYGSIRINMQILSQAHSILSWWLVLIGSIQIVYASLICSSQYNLKKRIAYSSISHMGFVVIGIGSSTDTGLDGALLQMLSHGLIGAALFFSAGACYDRTRTLSLDQLGGIAISMPKLFAMSSAFSMASFALPGMSGFVSELLVFLGIVTKTTYSPFFKVLVTVMGATSIVLTPIYLSSMLRKIYFGYKKVNYLDLSLNDIGPREIFILICFLLPILGIGLYPNMILSVWNSQLVTVFP